MSLLKTAGLVLLIFGVIAFVCMVDSELPLHPTQDDIVNAIMHVVTHPEDLCHRIGGLIGTTINGVFEVLDAGNNALIGAKEVR